MRDRRQTRSLSAVATAFRGQLSRAELHAPPPSFSGMPWPLRCVANEAKNWGRGGAARRFLRRAFAVACLAAADDALKEIEFLKDFADNTCSTAAMLALHVKNGQLRIMTEPEYTIVLNS